LEVIPVTGGGANPSLKVIIGPEALYGQNAPCHIHSMAMGRLVGGSSTKSIRAAHMAREMAAKAKK
jgi:hypothetical protein